MGDRSEIKDRILSTFGQVASTLGYSPLHGKIIGVLVVKDRPVSLNEVAEETGYSVSMISLSLDLLETLGVIRKTRKPGDRKLYIQLSGDLLDTLRRAVVMKVEKSINQSLEDFGSAREKLDEYEGPEKESIVKTLNKLEKELKRFNSYVAVLSKIRLP
jgi:DNA-binding transcriptional regulator GbsR (MarR family)